MKEIVLGVGEYGASHDTGAVIKTYSLGSCVALIMYDPVTKVGGMVHIALPESKIRPDMIQKRPGYFADTGIPALYKQMKKEGLNGHAKNLVIKLVGGAKVMDPNSLFDIGKRNILATKKLLWKYGLGLQAEDVGGSLPRTATIEIDTGKVMISSAGRGNWEI